jgi:hypothetical protein
MQFAGFLQSKNWDAEHRKPTYWMQLFPYIVGCTKFSLPNRLFHDCQREKKTFFHTEITFFHAGITFFHAGGCSVKKN